MCCPARANVPSSFGLEYCDRLPLLDTDPGWPFWSVLKRSSWICPAPRLLFLSRWSLCSFPAPLLPGECSPRPGIRRHEEVKFHLHPEVALLSSLARNGASPDRTSSVCLFVSGTKSDTSVPQSMQHAKISIKWSSHGWHAEPLQSAVAPFVSSGCAMIWAIVAPSFPLAALKPWHVLRYRVGKHSPGIMNVVALGPKLKKNCAKTYSVKRAGLLRKLYKTL